MFGEPETRLCEYGAHPEALGVIDGIRPYLDAGWLERGFQNDELCIRAKHFVGTMPFKQVIGDSGEVAPRLLMVLPKGCDANNPEEAAAALRRFVQLAFFHDHKLIEEIEFAPEKSASFGEMFLKLIARVYARVLTELCRHDFRRDYRHHEAELRGRVRGRIAVAAHLRNRLRGRAHVIPCRWEEFTADNWDNRVLLGAVRSLERYAGAISSDAARSIRLDFRPIDSWFSEVEESRVGRSDLQRMRLHRVSAHYRRAKRWADVILHAMGSAAIGSGLPAFAIDANKAFEEFVTHLTKEAASKANPEWTTESQQALPRKLFVEGEDRRPDVMILNKRAPIAIGDAKYKNVVEGSGRLDDADEVAKAAIGSDDWNQLYVYMRLSGAPLGFFVLPYWRVGGNPVIRIPREFILGPLDGGDRSRVVVFAINLMRSVAEIRSSFFAKFEEWMSQR